MICKFRDRECRGYSNCYDCAKIEMQELSEKLNSFSEKISPVISSILATLDRIEITEKQNALNRELRALAN